MRVIFMGTPDFAVPSLEALLSAGHDVAAVYTQPDKPKGRGLDMAPPPVKLTAIKHSIECRQPSSMKDPDVWKQIRETGADCIAVAAYGKLLPTEVLNSARYGCVNVHSSLLPKYRGAAPINWAVINGEKVTGVTIMQLNEGMDTGDILMQRETPIGPDENAGELHDRLAVMGAELLIETLDGLEKGAITPVRQDDSLASRAPMLNKTMCAVDWTVPAQAVHDKIRGLQPWPVAVCVLGGKRIKLFGSKLRDDMPSGTPGEIMSVSPLIIACGGGCVEITELQGEGGRRMSAADYLRGHHISAGDRAE